MIGKLAGSFTVILMGCALFSACASDSNDIEYNDYRGSLDEELRLHVTRFGLDGDPIGGRGIFGDGAYATPTEMIEEDAVAQLGMQLFYTSHLSGEMDTACVSCHVNTLGGADGLSMPIGPSSDVPEVMGPGRSFFAGSRGKPVPRNAPTMFNALAWDRCILQDCRIESIGGTPLFGGDDGNGISTPEYGNGREDPTANPTLLETHLRFPLSSEIVMRGFNFPELSLVEYGECLAGRLGGYGDCADHIPTDENPWPARFAEVYDPDGTLGDVEQFVTFANITDALLAYEHTLTFVETPWRAFIEGDDAALSEQQKRGALLFYRSVREGGANCVGCHSGDLFTDENFHNVGFVQVGPGTTSGPLGDADIGRGRLTGQALDMYAFRTPTLLNVEVSGPWGHNGAYTSLYDAVWTHLDPISSFEAFDFDSVPFTPRPENSRFNSEDMLAQMQSFPGYEFVDLEEADINDIVAFLYALTDPCVQSRECLAPFDPFNTGLDDPNMRLLEPVNPDGCSLVEVGVNCE